jgi:prephenate dehydratase
MTSPATTIAFQGAPGAYSDLACREVFPDYATLPCAQFEDAFAAVHEGRADTAMIPVENSLFGRVADIHHLLPEGGLHIVGEHFLRVRHCLLAPHGATLASVKEAHSHVQALGQCRNTLRDLGLRSVVRPDTAGAAKEVAAANDPSIAAVASKLAGEIYGLDVLRENLQDEDHNTTRFIILKRAAIVPPVDTPDLITTLVFRVRNIPAALFKALGGFATNGINISKLESYMVGGRFAATQFYADVDGHPESRSLRLALEELAFFAAHVKILGVYSSDPFRRSMAQNGAED